MDRSTSVVVEYSAAVEKIYRIAAEIKESFKVARDSAEALLREVAPKMNLPFPRPACTPDQWDVDAGNSPEGHVLIAWWGFVPALLVGTRFIMPNRLRATWDLSTRRQRKAILFSSVSLGI